DQIEKGSFDKTVLQPKLDSLASEIDKIRMDDRAALVKLHDLLDSEQRNAFVDALEKRLEAMKGEHADRMTGFRKLKELGDELKLTDIQRSQIHDVMREGFKERMKLHADGANGASPAEWHGRKGHAGPPMGKK